MPGKHAEVLGKQDEMVGNQDEMVGNRAEMSESKYLSISAALSVISTALLSFSEE